MKREEIPVAKYRRIARDLEALVDALQAGKLSLYEFNKEFNKKVDEVEGSPRTFTVFDATGSRKTYKGFDKNLHPLSRLDHVAIVTYDGEPELYAVDDPKELSGLVEYLSDQPEAGILQVAGVYSRKLLASFEPLV